MKSIISGAVLASAIIACLSLTSQAKPENHLFSTTTIAHSDTGKMDKMKMDKKMEKKKMDKMSKDKMKADKKMGKMKKDTSGKM
jgi:uncharacterized protein involved in copper resistance